MTNVVKRDDEKNIFLWDDICGLKGQFLIQNVRIIADSALQHPHLPLFICTLLMFLSILFPFCSSRNLIRYQPTPTRKKLYHGLAKF